VKTAVEMTKADANARKDDLRDDMALATQRATQIATSIRTGVLTPDEAKAITAKDKALSQLAAQLKPDAKPSAEERTQLLQHFSDVLGLVCKAKQEGGVALAMKKALKAKIESGAVLGAEAKDLVQKMRTMCSLRQTLAAAQGQVSAEKTKVLTDLRQLIMGLTE
jgi:hypothetical protein